MESPSLELSNATNFVAIRFIRMPQQAIKNCKKWVFFAQTKKKWYIQILSTYKTFYSGKNGININYIYIVYFLPRIGD
jgi:hypothetical protein